MKWKGKKRRVAADLLSVKKFDLGMKVYMCVYIYILVHLVSLLLRLLFLWIFFSGNLLQVFQDR